MGYGKNCKWEQLAISNGAVKEFQSFRVLGLDWERETLIGKEKL